MNDSRTGFGSLHMPRSRGAVSGLLLIILGVWGALVPFVGPYFHFAYTPGQVWVWSTARAWLEVFPGVTAAIGGFLLLVSGNRATAMFGGWLAVIAGAWFVVGRTLASTLRLGDVGHPIAATDAKRAAIEIAARSPAWARSSSSSAERCWRGCRSGWLATSTFAPNAETAPATDTYDAFTRERGTPQCRLRLRRESTGGRARVAYSVGAAPARRVTDA